MFNRKSKAQVDWEIKAAKAYQRLFNTPDGLIVLKDLQSKSFFLEAVTTKDGKDISMFNDGKRALFIDILNMAHCDVSKLIQKWKEIKDE